MCQEIVKTQVVEGFVSMQAWAEGPDVESRISLAPIAVQLTLAGPGTRGAYIALCSNILEEDSRSF